MDISLTFGAALLTAIVIGFGCGTGCGSLSTPFIITKLMGDQKEIKQSFFSLICFTMGKVSALVVLGIISSLIGKEVISFFSHSLPFDISLLFGAACIAFGISLFLIKSKGNKCNSCGRHKKKSALWNESSYFLSGILMAIVPCVPLLSILVYSATVNPFSAALLLCVFGIANSLTPLLIYVPLTGFVVSRMKMEIPRHMGKIRIISGCLLVLLGGSLFTSVI